MDNKKTIEKNSGICSTNLADEIAGTSRKVLFYRSGETGKDEIAAFTGQINFNKIEEIEIRYQKEPFVMGHLDWFQNLKRISIYAESDLKIRHSVFSDSVNPLQVIVYAIQGKQITIENNCSIACPKVDIKVVKAEEIHKEWINEIHQIKENVNVDDGLVPYYCSSIKNGLLMYEKSVIEMNNIAPLLKINDYSIHFIDLRYDEGAYRKKEETLLQRIKRDVQWLPSLEIELDNDKARISRMTQAESNLIYSYINDVTRVINAKYLAHNCPVDFHPTKINNIRENKETIAQQYARTDCLDQENEKAAHISKEEALNRIKAKQYMYCGKSFMRNRSDIKAEEELLQSLYRKNKTYFKDFSRFLDKMTKSCDGDTFLYCQIDAKKKEILVDINGIDCFVRRQNKTSNELSFFITLILLRCSFELAFIDKIDEEYYSEYQAIAAIFGRIVATHQLEEYLGRFDKRKMFGINGFHYNRIGEFEKYPETVCSVLDMLCLSENVDIYRQIIERAPNHLPGAYAMLCRQCSTRDHKLQYNKAYDAMAIRAFKEYHPDCTIKSIQQQFLTVPQSVIKELGFSNNEINKAIRNVSIYEHYEDQTLSEVLIDEHIHSIGFKAFARCENLKKLIIDTNGQLFIEPFAFAESALETIEIHAGSIVRISRFAFNRCTRLQKIIVDDEKETILHIEQSGFSGCSHSTLLIYNKTENTESEIGEEYCERGLEEGVRTQSHPDRMMGISPFESFSNIEFSNRIEYIQGDSKEVEPMCFAYCQNLEVVEIRDDSIKLCENAFYKCTNLREIIFPSLAYLRVKVHQKAFCGCGEIKITYPHQDNEERPPCS